MIIAQPRWPGNGQRGDGLRGDGLRGYAVA